MSNFWETPQIQDSGSSPAVSIPLVRKSSVYSLTLDKFQNNLSGSRKDIGSMNMDEFLKNIWTSEETRATNNAPNGNLQRQGYLTLPRTLSQKTVDDVWTEMFKEDIVGPHLQQQQTQPTLAEITLEEFFSRAGVVRVEAQPMERANNDGCFSVGSTNPNNNTSLTIEFQQSAQNNNQLSGSLMNMKQQLPRHLLPKKATVTSMAMTNNSGMFQGGTLGMSALVSGANCTMGSPANQLSLDVKARSNGDRSSLSPPPSYMLGKKSGTMEKAIERRQRRMIKNRESASRSRARKQAYNFELEAEVAKLKEINNELRKKQDEITEMQTHQALETVSKTLGLRRTLTGPL